MYLPCHNSGCSHRSQHGESQDSHHGSGERSPGSRTEALCCSELQQIQWHTSVNGQRDGLSLLCPHNSTFSLTPQQGDGKPQGEPKMEGAEPSDPCPPSGSLSGMSGRCWRLSCYYYLALAPWRSAQLLSPLPSTQRVMKVSGHHRSYSLLSVLSTKAAPAAGLTGEPQANTVYCVTGCNNDTKRSRVTI